MADLDAPLRRVEATLPSFLQTRRWFGAKGRPIARVTLLDHAVLDRSAGAVLAIAEVESAHPSPPTRSSMGSGPHPALSRGERVREPSPPGRGQGEGFTDEPESTAANQVYSLPLVIQPASNRTPSSDAVLIASADGLEVYDGLTDPRFCRALLGAIERGAEIASARNGHFAFSALPAGPLVGTETAGARVRVVGAEQSNTSVVFDDVLILKAFRRLQSGQNPELEILRFLAERTEFRRVPRLAGWGEYRPPSGEPTSLAILQSFVPSSGDGWSWALRELGRLLAAPPERTDEASVTECARASLDRIAALGLATAGLHLALATGDGVPDFTPEPIGPSDVERWRSGGLASLERGVAGLRAALERAPAGAHSTETERLARAVLDDEARLRAEIEGLEILTTGTVIKTRHHGDYHLGQVLDGADGWVILDFEGEPLRPLAERRALHTPLRDVAGMLRSLDYARHAAVREAASDAASASPSEAAPGAAVAKRADPPLPALAATWARLARRAFLDAYLAEARRAHARFLPPTDAALARALGALEREKALYELEYELGNRPDWVEIPLAALVASD